MKKTSSILFIFILALSFSIGCKEKTAKTYTSSETSSYEIVEVQGPHRLTYKRMMYKIVLSQDVKENQVKPTIEKIIDELTSDDGDRLWSDDKKRISDICRLFADIRKMLLRRNADIGLIRVSSVFEKGGYFPLFCRRAYKKPLSVRIGVCIRLHEVGIAGNRASAMAR